MPKEGETTGTKKCPNCGEIKHVLAFAVDRRMKRGLYYRCRDCEKKYQAARVMINKLKQLEIKAGGIGIRGLSTSFDEK